MQFWVERTFSKRKKILSLVQARLYEQYTGSFQGFLHWMGYWTTTSKISLNSPDSMNLFQWYYLVCFMSNVRHKQYLLCLQLDTYATICNRLSDSLFHLFNSSERKALQPLIYIWKRNWVSKSLNSCPGGRARIGTKMYTFSTRS